MLESEYPNLEQWYENLDTGQRFKVAAVDTDRESIDIEHLDGAVETMDLSIWYRLALERIDSP